MQVVYAREPFPASWSKSLFLAGPTPRSEDMPSWRPEALRLLEALGYDGTVLSPEDRGRSGCAVTPETYEPQIRWEDEAMRRADAVVFWVPRDLKDFPAFTTNIEWGEQFDSGRVALGYPDGAPKMGYFKTKAAWHRVPVAQTLDGTLRAAVAMIGEGASREGGETCVPIDIWRTESFRNWHAAQKAAGNRLLDARILWTYRDARAPERLFFWAIEVDMHVGTEDRVFKDGVVIGRPDVAGTVLFGPDRGLDTETVLVREFRPSASTSDGCVHEPANGSSWDGLAPAELAVAETAEEIGASLNTDRLHGLGARQLMPTLCAHRAHAYVARLTEAELEAIRRRAGRPHGIVADGERTWIEIFTVREIIEMRDPRTRDLDWSTVGMVLSAFHRQA